MIATIRFSFAVLTLFTFQVSISLVASFTTTPTVGTSSFNRVALSCRKRQRALASTIPGSEETTTPKRKIELVQDFVDRVQQSLHDKTFCSLTLWGAKTKKNKKAVPSTAEDPWRGSIRQVQGRLIVLPSKTTATTTTNNKAKKKIPAEALQLTIKYHGATDICKNLSPDEISTQLAKLLLEPLASSEWGAAQARPFQGAELKTLHGTWELKALHPGTQARLDKAAVSGKDSDAANRVLPERHDRTKQVPLAQTTDTTFLQALGLTKPDGSPRLGMSSKLRQCNKFVEILSGLVSKRTSEADSNAKAIRVVDMGCGRGYLTFALHSYLSDNFAKVTSVGIDVRPKLVAEISNIAQSLDGTTFQSLSFERGTIEEIVAGSTSIFDGTTTEKSESEMCLNILIALHACDTATDDALWSGISQGADIIAVAPCCHKQVRAQVNAHIAAIKDDHPLFDILKHGVYRERMSETATDSLRALLLEHAGYKVQVFEFIGGEHTSKNVMITAVRNPKSNDKTKGNIMERIQQLASFHGIQQQKLADWMGESLGDDAVLPVANGRTKRSATQMPPISN